jgi:hypothetical protein
VGRVLQLGEPVLVNSGFLNPDAVAGYDFLLNSSFLGRVVQLVFISHARFFFLLFINLMEATRRRRNSIQIDLFMRQIKIVLATLPDRRGKKETCCQMPTRPKQILFV